MSQLQLLALRLSRAEFDLRSRHIEFEFVFANRISGHEIWRRISKVGDISDLQVVCGELSFCRRRILPERERRDTQRLQTGGESIWRLLNFNDRTAPGQAVAGANEASNGGAFFRFEGQRDRDCGNVAPARRPPGTEVACWNRYSPRPGDDFNESINH